METKPTITFDDFSKLDIRVGTIVSAEIVPDADKLLRLEVDLGDADGPRQIVSGIRDYFPDPEVLVEKQTSFVANLEPRTIRGLESNGMLFALKPLDDEGEPDGLELMHPAHAVTPGSPLV